jgi:CheY-like chemotaxis protein
LFILLISVNNKGYFSQFKYARHNRRKIPKTTDDFHQPAPDLCIVFVGVNLLADPLPFVNFFMTLLCIDDDPDDVEMFCEAVETFCSTCRCVIAWNGREALRILQTLRPDFVFLDMNMPIMDGKETLKYIRENQCLKDLPVCILSTSINPDEVAMLKKLGANNCLIKPGEFDALCSDLKLLLEKIK